MVGMLDGWNVERLESWKVGWKVEVLETENIGKLEC